MKTIDLQFNFTKVPTDLAEQIQRAIETDQPFALTNGRSVNLFNPKTLQHYFRIRISDPAIFTYPDPDSFFKGISLALLSCKEFVPAGKMVAFCEEKKLTMPLNLDYDTSK